MIILKSMERKDPHCYTHPSGDVFKKYLKKRRLIGPDDCKGDCSISVYRHSFAFNQIQPS